MVLWFILYVSEGWFYEFPGAIMNFASRHGTGRCALKIHVKCLVHLRLYALSA